MNKDLFWSKVNKNGPVVRQELGNCWIWTGGVRKGYGLVAYYKEGERTTTSAHRWAWILDGRTIENGRLLRHKCDVSLCVRPEHMERGTYKENNHDKLKRNRGFSLLTNEMVDDARRRTSAGESIHEIIKNMPKGLSVNSLAGAIRGKTFLYSTEQPCEPVFIKRINRKLTEEQHLEIIEALKKPYHGQGRFLAKKYGVDPSTITLIKQNKTAPEWLVSKKY